MTGASEAGSAYLDMQAEIGVTKHIGGSRATDELLERCAVEASDRVLYVGSGIGAGPCYVARTRGCRVVAADISDKMLEWTAKRVREEHCEDRVEACKADIVDLPFDDGGFDVVLVESVFAFVTDKQRGLSECVRVTRPGGRVGVNDSVWLSEPPPGKAGALGASMGTEMSLAADWERAWAESGLEERTFSAHGVDVGEETRSRVKWVGGWWLARAWGRALRLALTDGTARRSLREQVDAPPSLVKYMGYTLMTGRKPPL
jgi:SAM-dependent methyltransferase